MTATPVVDTLEGYEWVVEDIGGRGIIDRSHVTLMFEDGRVYGRASCNRYFADYATSGGRLDIGQAGATRMACAPALMNQEAVFLRLLGEVNRYSFGDSGALILQTASDEHIIARRE